MTEETQTSFRPFPRQTRREVSLHERVRQAQGSQTISNVCSDLIKKKLVLKDKGNDASDEDTVVGKDFDASYSDNDDNGPVDIFNFSQRDLQDSGFYKNIEFNEPVSKRYDKKNRYIYKRDANGRLTRARTVSTWTQEEYQLFLELLSIYGADFSTISKHFLNKTRRDIKNKFRSEKRKNTEGFQSASNSNQSADLHRFASIYEKTSEQLIEDLLNNEEVFKTHKKSGANSTVQSQVNTSVPSEDESNKSDDDFEEVHEYVSLTREVDPASKNDENSATSTESDNVDGLDF